METQVPNTSNLSAMSAFIEDTQALLRRGQRDHDLTEVEFSFLAALWSRLNTPLTQYAARCFKAQDDGKLPDPQVLSIYRKLATFVGALAPLHRELENNQQMRVLTAELVQHAAFGSGVQDVTES